MRLLFVLGIMALSGCSPAPDEAPPPGAGEPRAVHYVTVGHRNLEGGLAFSGRLVAREEAAVASQLSGYQVARVLVDQSASVRAGQSLAMLDDTLLRADIAQQRAALAQARVAAEKADQEALRVASLDKSGVLSEESIAERRLAARTARAQLAQAQAQLAAQEVRQSLMIVRAPVAGRILERTVRPGDVASPSTVMFRIARGGEVEVDAEIPEQSVDLVHIGDTASVTLPSGAKITGRIRLVGAEIDPETKLGRARILLPVRKDLRPGGFAQVAIVQKGVPVNAVPEGAVSYGADGASLTVLGPRNIVKVVPVTIGQRSGGYAELRSGPPAGTHVLLDSQGFVLSGDRVNAVPAATREGR